ncbi:MAG: amidohydrolase family protein [Saprospiraceae bacterium]|nr:amidohydrolase family protein [Saprospiraceae bacterium]
MRRNASIATFLILVCAGIVVHLIQTDTTEPQAATYTGPIIDMHVHAFTDRSNAMMFGMTHPPTLRGETYPGVASAEEQKQKTLQKFREHNIVKAIVTNGHLWLDDAPDQILIGMANRPVEVLREQHAEGRLHAVAEMAPFYSGRLASDSLLRPFFALAHELAIPVGFHVLPGGPNYGLHLMPQMLGGMRAYNANPMQLEEVLSEFPDLKLYIMHGGWPYIEDLKALMYAHPNLYVDIAVLNWILPQEELNAYLKALITAGFGDRIMFGSDQMVWPDVISVGVASVNNAEFLTLDQKEDIFYDNAARFLGLSDEEIAQHKSMR